MSIIFKNWWALNTFIRLAMPLSPISLQSISIPYINISPLAHPAFELLMKGLMHLHLLFYLCLITTKPKLNTPKCLIYGKD